jgi:cardiolipin synthase A/B
VILQAALAEPQGAESWQWVLLAFALLGELLAVVFVYRIVVRGGSPSSTLLWVVLILAAPWIGLLVYYLLPRRLQLRRLRKMRVRGARLREVRPSPGAADGGAAEPGLGLRALLQGADGAGTTAGNSVRWLASGKEFVDAAVAAISAAERQVHFVVYILRPDAAGLQLLSLLTEAARRGVVVRLLYDSFGSFGLKRGHLAALRAAGGHAVAFLPLLWKRRPFTVNLRNHRKLLIVDGEVGFLGGRNVGDEYWTDRVGRRRIWLDAMVELRGPVVQRLQDVFVEDWCTATDEVLVDACMPKSSPVSGVGSEVGVVCSGPDRDQSDLWFAVVQAIGGAERSVELSSPYLLLPPVMLFALQLAVARGVTVRVYTNGPRTEAPVLYHAQRSFYAQLLQSGVELYETIDHYNHAKVIVVDGRHVVVGSANMDLRSAQLNFEIAAVVIDDEELAQSVQATTAERRKLFRAITPESLPQSPFWRMVDGACGLLSPLL